MVGNIEMHEWNSIKKVPLLDKLDGAIVSSSWSRDGGWKLPLPNFMHEIKVSTLTKETFDNLEVPERTKRSIKNLMVYTKCQKIRYINECCTDNFKKLVNDVSAKNFKTILRRIKKFEKLAEEIPNKHQSRLTQLRNSIRFGIGGGEFPLLLSEGDMIAAINEVKKVIAEIDFELFQNISDDVYRNISNLNFLQEDVQRKKSLDW